MTVGSIIVLAVVAVAIACAVGSLIYNHRSGKSSCGCGDCCSCKNCKRTVEIEDRDK
ncbi:hypothetical protein TALC_00536 [Thermoplasmatales archaeon BRNA1]|nr:hypothetical protein TALC_00536 [Thermoplasmatales archaeon BRNA1]